GQFIVRIDDTDRERSTRQSLDEILADLKWLGMEWDEGPPDEAYFQTNRVGRHREAARKLLRERKAYPCYCSAEELDAKRKQAARERRRPVYDRKCRGLGFPSNLALPDKSAPARYPPPPPPSRLALPTPISATPSPILPRSQPISLSSIMLGESRS